MENLWDKTLYKKLESELGRRFLQEIKIPEYISNNVKYEFYDWQRNALKYFLAYNDSSQWISKRPTHLMFNMATGTGKTLLMAATILYYYQQGYRHFLFFVNQNNIVDKTENNLINSNHTKYLFTQKIVIDDARVAITQVETFSDAPHGIEIKFTSIQKLHNDIHTERENQTTLDDLHRKDIVMLADEAHHLNAKTKKANVMKLLFVEELKGNASAESIEKLGWEHTVIDLILHKNNTGNKNVLLEFTATIPEAETVVEKYNEKIIYKFELKNFLKEGYTKEINLISSTLNKKERTIQALLFQWYRHTVALKHGLANFKPVILFRSKTIEDSQQDYEEFLYLIDILSRDDFTFVDAMAKEITLSEQREIFTMGASRIRDIITYLTQESISFEVIIEWLKQSYRDKNVIITNSKDTSAKTTLDQDKLINSLEDTHNYIRALFTVNRLTEGWDVLNLFDIVRLYEGRDESQDKAGNRKAGKSTISEKQLIGRGVRYYPFCYEDKIKNKRKFDDNVGHELRILEELYFHSTNDHRYIDELKRELKKEGYISDDRVYKTLDLKKEFKDSSFYEDTRIWYNTQIENPDRKKKSLNDIISNLGFTYAIKGLEVHEEEIDFDEKKRDTEKLDISKKELRTILMPCKEIERHIFLKAVNIKANQENSLYQFKQLQQELEITSIDELQKEQFLGGCELRIVVEKSSGYDDLENKDKLDMILKFLDTFFAEFKKYIIPKKGSEFRVGTFKQFFSTPKTKIINERNKDDSIAHHDWYVLDSFVGTSEEKELITFIKNSIGNLEKKYERVNLLKNEEVYKIYDFEQGRGFQPDFLLFLKDKAQQKLHYQIFIEPKGTHLLEYDKWKENFLLQIAKKHNLNPILQAEHFQYKLIGLPFFNAGNNSYFETEYERLWG